MIAQTRAFYHGCGIIANGARQRKYLHEMMQCAMKSCILRAVSDSENLDRSFAPANVDFCADICACTKEQSYDGVV